MTAKQILLDQLAACRDKSDWFVSAAAALKGLTASQAARRDDTDEHSVWQIVNHILFWNQRFLDRFQGRPVAKLEDVELAFEGERTSGSEAQWQTVVANLDGVMAGWIEAVRGSDEARLESRLKPDDPGTWYGVLTHMTIHTAHHLGQIVTLRKSHGAWDAAKGWSA